ncbi:MAG TPA: ribonuclease HII [Candidatus Binatia bacterium]|jgi:ribonuclease HII
MKRSQAWLSDDFALPERPDTLFEEKGYARGFKHVAGLDEVGRGPWAGPVVAAAVILPRGITHPEIRDSKLLTSKKREELAWWVKQEAVTWALGIVGPEEIDRINILRASLLAMSVAIKRMKPVPDLLLIDGDHTIPLMFLTADDAESQVEDGVDAGRLPRQSPRAPIRGPSLSGAPGQKAIVKGDLVCHSIAAASILAKVARDQLMKEIDELYPEYGFRQHKGYGSQAHADALKRLGPSPIHRRSYSPVWKSFENGGGFFDQRLFDK